MPVRQERFGWSSDQGLVFSPPAGDYQVAHDLADVAAEILGGLGVGPETLDEPKEESQG